MAKKELSAVLAKRLNAMGIKVKTDDEARKKLLKVLSDNGIDGMEDETIDVLIDMAESFVEDETSEEEEKSEEEKWRYLLQIYIALRALDGGCRAECAARRVWLWRKCADERGAYL